MDPWPDSTDDEMGESDFQKQSQSPDPFPAARHSSPATGQQVDTASTRDPWPDSSEDDTASNTNCVDKSGPDAQDRGVKNAARQTEDISDKSALPMDEQGVSKLGRPTDKEASLHSAASSTPVPSSPAASPILASQKADGEQRTDSILSQTDTKNRLSSSKTDRVSEALSITSSKPSLQHSDERPSQEEKVTDTSLTGIADTNSQDLKYGTPVEAHKEASAASSSPGMSEQTSQNSTHSIQGRIRSPSANHPPTLSLSKQSWSDRFNSNPPSPATPSDLLNLSKRSSTSQRADFSSVKEVEKKPTQISRRRKSSHEAELVKEPESHSVGIQKTQPVKGPDSFSAPRFSQHVNSSLSSTHSTRSDTMQTTHSLGKSHVPQTKKMSSSNTTVIRPKDDRGEKGDSPHVHIQSPLARTEASSSALSSETAVGGHKEHHSKLSDLVRNAIIGFSDGLTVPFALVAGLSALNDKRVVIVGGLAELFAGTISMGLGALLAAFTERTRYESEEKREWQEVKNEPLAEEEEIYDILAKYGISREASFPVVEGLKVNEDMWVKFMMDFELQLQKPSKRKAYLESFVMGLSYFIGGIFPLLPFIIFAEDHIRKALFTAVGIAVVLLLVFGYAKSKAAGAAHKKAMVGAIQMLLIGALAAGLAYVIVWAINKG